MSVDIVDIFCDLDDFCKSFENKWMEQLISDGKIKRLSKSTLSMSEIMTIVVWFHNSGYRTFKWYYINHVQKNLRSEFPNLLSYSRFVELMPRVVVPLCAYLGTRRGRVTGISFIDSIMITVCKNQRIPSHRVFYGVVERGKSSMGWFYGFKLHLVINDRGEFLAFKLTPANTDDRIEDQCLSSPKTYLGSSLETRDIYPRTCLRNCSKEEWSLLQN
jgi:hypothetical protein